MAILRNLLERDGKTAENWYIACTSKEITKKPIQRILYDTKVVLFRERFIVAHLQSQQLNPPQLIDRDFPPKFDAISQDYVASIQHCEPNRGQIVLISKLKVIIEDPSVVFEV